MSAPPGRERVENAVIMAAGLSSRFAPLSYEKPKGLLEVRGEVLIERQIRQLREAGIDDITVVTGYMADKFAYLAGKFGVRLVFNEDYRRFNNSASLRCVKDRLGSTYVCSADDYFTENVFEPSVEGGAYYAATFFPGRSSEWGIVADDSGRITAIDHAPCDMWCMLGHVYFDRRFSETFVRLLDEQWDMPETRQGLWESLFERNIEKFRMRSRKYPAGVVAEFDSLEDLRAFDARYVDSSGSAVFANICRTLGCRESEITSIAPLREGLTNLSFKFALGGRSYVYRHPGAGTEDFISRKSEAFSLAAARRLGLDPTLVAMDPEGGWRISHFMENARTLDYRNPADVAGAAALLRRLHDAALPSPYVFDIWARSEAFCEKLPAAPIAAMREKMARLHARAGEISQSPVLCHCDSYAPNFLIDPAGSMALIDWEYSGAADPGVDIGTFVCCSPWTRREADLFLELYRGRAPSPAEREHDYAYIALAAWYWYVWALHQEAAGNSTGEWLELWRNAAETYLAAATAACQSK